MQMGPTRGRPVLPRAALWAAAAVLAVCALALPSGPAAAETPINETETSFLYTLGAAGSPYLLSHDFRVLPGGTLFIGAGVELQFENGAVLRGAGGDISIQGSAASPAVLRAKPGAAAPAWGGIRLGTGSDLHVSNAVLHNGTPMVTANDGSSVFIDLAAVDGCGAWCISVSGAVGVWLANSTFADGVLGYTDAGSDLGRAANLTFTNFSGPAVTYGSATARATLSDVRITGTTGVLAEGTVIAQFARLDIHVTDGPALGGNGSGDVRVHNSTLVSDTAWAVDMRDTSRLRLETSHIDGGAGALRLPRALAPELRSNSITSAGGACLELPAATQALLVSNLLTGCARTLSVPPGTAPPNATAGPTNTVDGRPFLWVDGASDLVVSATSSASYGLVVLVSVQRASVSGLTLEGAGVFLFGCQDVVVEGLHVTGAAAGITAVGTRGLHVVAYRAESVGSALEAWSDAAFPVAPADYLVERARVEGATGSAFSFRGVTNLTLRWTLVQDAAVAVRLEQAAGALLANLITRGAGTAVWISNSTDIVLVDSSIEGSSTLGLLAQNATGTAARNAFVDNTEHASAPGSPGFAFNEVLAGNYWSNWSAPDANMDGWADIPYNLTDGTGADARPRVVRWDFHPTALAAAPAVVQLGQPATLDATPSFDDFQVAESYWSVDAQNDNATGQGFSYVWTPNATGPHTVTLSVVGSLGATDEYAFTIEVVDTTAPSVGFEPIGRAEAGMDISVRLTASDNDPRFPAGIRVEWELKGAGGPSWFGNSSALNFTVRIPSVGSHELTVLLLDAAGNTGTATLVIEVFDTTPPEVSIAFEGDPDLALPFVLDASATYDPSGVNASSARWSWVEDATTREVTGFPVGEVTFNHAGNYTVTLHVCDMLGNCGQGSVELTALDTHGPRLLRVHVVAPQRDPVDVTPAGPLLVDVRAGDEVVFEAFAEDPSGTVSFLWDFGDGTTGQGSRVVHRFARTGEVTVSLTMSDPLGNTNPAAFRVKVSPSGGFFGEIIPGVSGDLVVLVLVVGVAAAAAFVYVRRRRPPAPKEPGLP